MKKRQKTLVVQISDRIARKRSDVVLRQDFLDLGDYDQVGRSLRTLIRTGKLIKIGQSIYVRTAVSPIDNQPTLPKSLSSLTLEAMKRLEIPTGMTKMESNYNAGKTTQVPTERAVGVHKRVRRRIGFGGYHMSFEPAVSISNVTKTIHALAVKHGIIYQETGYDILADHITRLSGDDVRLDPTELLLVELERSGHIEGRKATLLHADYLRNVKYAHNPNS